MKISAPSFPAVFAQLHQWVFARLPAAYRDGFAGAIAYDNWLHAVGLATVAAVVNALFGLLPEVYYYATGFWRLDRLHLGLTLLHGAMLGFSVVALAVLLRLRPATPGTGRPCHGRLALGYCTVMLAFVTLFSVVEQRLTGSISAYLLGLAGFSTLFYTSLCFSLIVGLVSFLVLLGGSFLQASAPAVVWHQMFVAFDAVAIFWVASRIIYSLKIANHIQLATIGRQAGELAAANVRLARAEQFKTDLLAVAAHDIRDPLNTISLSAQYLRDEIPAGSPLRRVVLGIDDSARRLAEFVGNLLTDTTSDTQEIDLQLTAVKLPELVADIVSRFQPIAGAKDIALHFTAADSARHAPPASVDPARYRQIVENLVTNAIKYSPAHKNVWVELAHTPADGHRLTVRDEGPGLTPADQARLFRKYQRLSARPTAGENSTGLGLFIVKNLVTLHGGRVWAESQGGGGGAQFVVTVP